MKLSLYTDDLREAPVDLLAVGVFSDEPDRGLTFAHLNRGLDGALESACREEDFKGRPGQTLVFNVGGGLLAKRVLVYGYGPRAGYGPEAARRLAGEAARVALKVGAASMALQLTIPEQGDGEPQSVLALVQALAEGAELGTYRYVEYRTKEQRPTALKEAKVAFVAEDVQGIRGAQLRAALQKGQAMADAVAVARDLVNCPPNVLTPIELSERAKKVAKAHELAIKVLTVRDMERQNMNLHLGVGKGSRNEPRLVHMTYTPDKKTSDRVICLVGKGLTFDAGGLSLKPADGMMEMKIDMGGAAAVIGAMQAVANLKPGCVVHGIIGAAENMPDGNAIRPGDIITGKKGISVEILNTDAEGRLVLADALAYAQDQRPTDIVDLATLTGACMVALGKLTAGAFVREEDLAEDLAAAWKESGEAFWRMPLDGALRDQLDSDVADIKNLGERWGGAITAALFLQAFVDEGVRWAHLDVAGPVFSGKAAGHTPKGATGFGVRTLAALVERLAARTEA
ncbi:MAG: leucyl aminopeptidase [Myxococcales bacterium]|nr:leucyl aminopeptidase [Myxococcales bacterium]MCB9648326.1 leucyl aminopeptidase [Deltaproteobacteria bacterium]